MEIKDFLMEQNRTEQKQQPTNRLWIGQFLHRSLIYSHIVLGMTACT